MTRYRLFGTNVDTDFPLTNIPSDISDRRSRARDLTFSCVPLCTPPRWQSLPALYTSSYRTADGQSVLSLYRLGGSDALHFPETADFFLGPHDIVCRHRADADMRAIELQFLSTVFAYWLEQRGWPALHAAAVLQGDRAVAFVSASRGGKSVLAAAFAQHDCAILADDIVAIERAGDAFVAHPAYPHVRLWPEEAKCFLPDVEHLEPVQPSITKYRVPLGTGLLGRFSSAPARLTRMYLLQRYEPHERIPRVDIEPLPPRDALIALVRHSFAARIVQATGLQPRRLPMLAEMARSVPMRRLIYPSGLSYLPAVREAIVRDAAAR